MAKGMQYNIAACSLIGFHICMLEHLFVINSVIRGYEDMDGMHQ